MSRIQLAKVAWPTIESPDTRPQLPDSCFTRRLAALRQAMEQEKLDCVVLYADREHYANFKYYLGFEPRFEEGVAVLFRDETVGDAVLLGNECRHMDQTARIPVRGILCQLLSLPGQPMDQFVSMEASLQQAGIHDGMRIGLAGWKWMTTKHGPDPLHMFCACSFLVDALRSIVGDVDLINATGLLINPYDGLRLLHDADEIAYMEYGAAIASDGVAKCWKEIAPGKREMELAACMNPYGQQLSCHTMFSSGENTKKGLVSPAFRTLEPGDPVSFSLGMEGGLSCRGGYVAHCAAELPEDQRHFEAEVALPYYETVVAWYEAIGIGVTGGQMYDEVQRRTPKEQFGWTLNPGHLISYEEWLCSGIAPHSTCAFRSGMLVQMDIIPAVPPYVSPNAEDGICLADEGLRRELRQRHPDTWKRFMQRREFMRDELGICLKEEVLPMSNLAGRYSPYLLDHELAFSSR